MENINDNALRLSFIAEMTQFPDIIKTLSHKRIGNDASPINLDRNNETINNEFAAGSEISVSFNEGVIDKKGIFIPKSYDTIKGIDYKILDKFFNRLYEKNLIRFPEQKLNSFYEERKEYFEKFLQITEVRLKDCHSLVKDILLFLNDKIKQNKTFPPQQIETKVNKLNTELIEALPHYEQCFFVHYQFDHINEAKNITALNIYSKGEGKEYAGSEAENIKEYAKKINELQNEGLTLVHWNQNRNSYGTAHIKKRYKELTGDNLELEYSKKFDLAKWLCEKYGNEYVPHERLDNLAKLNKFSGVKETEGGQHTFAENRLLLITKIYFNAFSNTLKIAETEQKSQREFFFKEYALAYIFDLYANGKQLPVNKIEGGLSKKLLIKIGFELYQFDEKKDTFYRAVKEVAEFDLNKKDYLKHISIRWIEAVKAISKDWDKVESYLKEKKLLGNNGESP